MQYKRSHIDTIVGQVFAAHPQASDVIATAGRALQAEVDGELCEVVLEPALGTLSPEDTKGIAMGLMAGNKRLHTLLSSRGSCDFSISVTGVGRFRVNVFKQRGTLAVVMRRLPTSVPSIDSLGLPNVFADIAAQRHGLALVTGGTGQGKSNSLAAVVDRINRTRAVHVVTLEDPVEFVHSHDKATVNQRELGLDFDSFASGLRSAFRQAPKVILVGEIRDRETMAIALEAAGTGHLVLATLHTTDTGAAISRILALFDATEERLIRMRLAESLYCVVGQRLVPDVKGGRVAAFEVLRNTIRVRDHILSGIPSERSFYDLLMDGEAHGMMTFDQSLLELFRQERITEETARLAATDRGRLQQWIDAIRAGRGEKTSDLELEGLEEQSLDEDDLF
ncbi:type IV pilus twitching motility protein PilT [Salidesulfovibrio brasiliensis]|uniref:type IV pilus twitching motility protein PilT n=1 Tax=Salidesulfovibrio brasiliensis TaxID=221711 RepID=UPI0006D273AF|nr:PilT/PilU family type 4a pilus ATPase [Salidesulfovibrio brasiliensis]